MVETYRLSRYCVSNVKGMFRFKGNLLSILPKPVEISHEWVLKSFKYQETSFYARLFDRYEEVTFEVPPDRRNFGVIRTWCS